MKYSDSLLKAWANPHFLGLELEKNLDAIIIWCDWLNFVCLNFQISTKIIKIYYNEGYVDIKKRIRSHCKIGGLFAAASPWLDVFICTTNIDGGVEETCYFKMTIFNYL